MEYLNGKNLQKKFLNQIKEEVSLLGIKPTLAIISTGNNEVNNLFLKQIKSMCEFVGYKFNYYHYEDISEDTLYKLITKLNKDNKITSILILNPLLKHLNTMKIRNAITKNKDIDGINDLNRISYFENEGGFIPATVLGIKYLLESYNIDIKEKNITIINRKEILGKTLANYFLNADCSVTICHSKTKNLESYIKNSDIVVTAIGKANFISSSILKENSIIIDIGIEELDGKYYGDIKIEKDNKKNIYMAKSIGGVGPMTIAALSKNILTSYYLNKANIDNQEF